MNAPHRHAAHKARVALRRAFAGATDERGYVSSPQQNLVHGVRLEQFEDDLRRGDGDELRMKFRAVHSSAALAINCFAPFKDRLGDIQLLGRRGAVGIEFEKRLTIFPDRRPANLDVWIDQRDRAVAIESKLLEYFTVTIPAFAPAYERLAPPVSEPSWWAAYVEAKEGAPRHLDRAQLLKHYFGLRRLQQALAASRDLTLLYLFWEPLNWEEISECLQHRKELEAFADRVAGSSITFRWMTYPQLWREWMEVPALGTHAGNLRERYEVCL